MNAAILPFVLLRSRKMELRVYLTALEDFDISRDAASLVWHESDIMLAPRPENDRGLEMNLTILPELKVEPKNPIALPADFYTQ